MNLPRCASLSVIYAQMSLLRCASLGATPVWQAGRRQPPPLRRTRHLQPPVDGGQPSWIGVEDGPQWVPMSLNESQ